MAISAKRKSAGEAMTVLKFRIDNPIDAYEMAKELSSLQSPAWAPLVDLFSTSSNYGVSVAQNTLKSNNSYAFGVLYNSLQTDVANVSKNKIHYEYGTNIKYSTDVEYGQKPNWIPDTRVRSHLVPWVEVKRIASGAEAVRVAYAVRNKIARVGTEAKPYFAPSFDKVVARIERLLANRISLAINKARPK